MTFFDNTTMLVYEPLLKKGGNIMDYEITFDTQAIIPIDENTTKAIEEDEEYIVNNNILNVLEHSCEYFGSSYAGRKEGTKKLLGVTHKAPIIIEESRKMIFFPTSSPEKSSCIWINLEKVDNYFKVDKKSSAIKFKNGDVLRLDISYGSLANQILRSTRLKYILEERINKKEDNIL